MIRSHRVSFRASSEQQSRVWRRAIADWPARSVTLGVSLACTLAVSMAETAPASVSYVRDVVPIFKRSCTGCHHPGKLKGELDLTTFAGLAKGGKHGLALKPGDPKSSRLIEEISGPEPSMPKEGDPLSKDEVERIARWIAEGSKDDSPKNEPSWTAKEPPIYREAPVTSALAFSPDGAVLAVSGYHEILLHKADGSKLITRLVGESPRIDSIAYSADGKLLGASGGAPARFGELQIWDATSHQQLKALKISTDTLYGICFSPDAQQVAFGCADKTVRTVRVADGKELLKFDNHSDWVLATSFTKDGKRLLSGSRDRAMKLIDATSGQFIDDINKLIESVFCFARHPSADQVVYGGDQGGLRIYKMAENQQRTAANNDANLIREFERQPGPVRAVAFSPDGQIVAAGGGYPEVGIFRATDGTRVATLPGNQGSTFAMAFNPVEPELATGGFDGTIRLVETKTWKLTRSFVPVPLEQTTSPNAQISTVREAAK